MYLREDPIKSAVNAWVGGLFDRDNVDRTVAALVASQRDGGDLPVDASSARQRLADAEGRLRRFQAAIAAGIDPAALVEPTNEALADRAATRAELEGLPAPNTFTEAEVHAMIDSLGNVGRPGGVRSNGGPLTDSPCMTTPRRARPQLWHVPSRDEVELPLDLTALGGAGPSDRRGDVLDC